ncbi:hypothetical protein LTR10_015009 [Elasticomyces elasticus]|nr:hypothetical protein LTR10_015009 [Elasticomyces elasticus]KAK4964585.1 hypothetical protein LTR42_012883 [Elasticomyces elasticus]
MPTRRLETEEPPASYITTTFSSNCMADKTPSHTPEFLDSAPKDGWSEATNTTGIISHSCSHFAGPPLRDSEDIRIIVVEPGSGPPRMSFTVTNLRAPVSYYALSYAWGPILDDGSHLTATLDLDGHQVRVTSHLRQAFSRISQHYGGTGYAIWCDAICIDQANVAERNCQVAMMGRIYARANAVLIWLGEEASETWLPAGEDSLLASEQRSKPDENPMRRYFENVSSIEARLMIQSPYFTRRWEVVMQPRRHLLAGGRCLHFEALYQAVLASALPIPLCFIYRGPGQRTLLDNLIFYSDMDPRDRIYALLAISGDICLAPEYSVDYRTICTDVAAACIGRGWLLDIIIWACETRQGSPPSSQWPTWVPDWRGRIASAVISPLVARTQATKPFPNQIYIESGQLHLEARLQWLCDATNTTLTNPIRCRYREAATRISSWRNSSNISGNRALSRHGCLEGEYAAVCYPVDDSWGLLLASAPPEANDTAMTPRRFIVKSWFSRLAEQPNAADRKAGEEGSIWYTRWLMGISLLSHWEMLFGPSSEPTHIILV